MATFTWTPSYSTAVSEDMRILRAQFGEGYSQRAGDGINPIAKRWNLVFTGRTLAEMDAIRAFLIALSDGTSFDWTDPDGEAGKYICMSVPRSFGGYDNFTANFLFEQVFGE